MMFLLLLAVCTDCHKTEAAHFAQSAMGHALSRDTAKWTFGAGKVGKTWMYEKDGRWYESKMSYYKSLNGLDLTIGHQIPKGLDEVFGRLTSPTEAKQCFSCHTITCETCHGEDPHTGKFQKMNAEEHNDFCGKCHRTWASIAANGPRGIQNIRFQPYRLALSKCPDLRCSTCHEPHSGVVNDPKCATCHQSCKAGETKNCVSCHMPRLELPGAHAKFTDHKIRVVRPNERYPD